LSFISFGHCVVSPSMYGFWWALWYLQTLLAYYLIFKYWLRPSAINNRTNIIHITTFVSRRLYILCIMVKITAFLMITADIPVICGSMWRALAWPHHITISLGPQSIPPPRHYLLKCLYQARKVRGHVCLCNGYKFCHFLWICYWIMNLFRQGSIYCLPFYRNLLFHY
jgi:hypothetical protein